MDAEIDDVFRTEWPRLVAFLVRDVGDLGEAEDAVQDAFVEASIRWPVDGRPDRPGAWLLTTARRRSIDRLRRSRRFAERIPELARRVDAPEPDDVGGLVDPRLAVLLGCCHPALHHEAQVALTLRAVAGLTTAQIARAFLVSEATMTRRLTRAKTKVRAARIPFGEPDRDTLDARLVAVCDVVYSIFTEGHTSATDAELVRGDLCDEAIWLSGLLAELVPDDPEVLGLYALVLLVDARRAGRVVDDAPVLLAEQDRSTWDRGRIEHGLAVLARAHSHRRSGPFQLQAAVAAIHATAPSIDETDWAAVVDLYDAMLHRRPTALVALNRAIAVGRAEGAQAGLVALDAIADADDLEGDLDGYVYFHSARAEMLADLERHDESRAAFRRAIECSTNDAERRHLRRRSVGPAGNDG